MVKEPTTHLLIPPNQLFAKHPGLADSPDRVILLEDSLFFGDAHYPAEFHQQKVWLHRATMKRYESELRASGYDVVYVEYQAERDLAMTLDGLKPKIKQRDRVSILDPVDFIFERRLRRYCERKKIELQMLSTPGFLNSREQNEAYRSGTKRWFMAEFYKWQRKRLKILVDEGEPVGGRWSFDEDNRKKVPKKLVASIPKLLTVKRDAVDTEAADYVERCFADRPGSIETLYYPTSHKAAARWLKHFLEHRLELFGDYEDAILEGESWLWHSVLTPMLNIGLLTPKQVMDATIKHAAKHEVPLNSLEGFVRQVIGWREFMRATYVDLGVTMRTTNHWGHHRSMPRALYEGSTGIAPIDDTIRRILATGYCHHIERLMVLGGFMFLCEIDPDAIYRWFMELFVDSYDWVMVPNVYAMSQNADGGLITTKPYFSGSSYVRKMSHHKKGPWCDVWDGLYWRWIWNHAEELAKNPRWAMMCSMARKMETEKRERHLQRANEFLGKLS